MVTYILDASAVLRFLDGEAGVDRVKALFAGALAGECSLSISAVNWGEVVGKLHQRYGPTVASNRLERLLRKNLTVIPATMERAARAGIYRITYRIPYADTFGVEAASYPDHVLVTADFDVQPASGVIQIEFLPTKPLPTGP
jgi:PIN domain nuclease of toxin-antitoxin system